MQNIKTFLYRHRWLILTILVAYAPFMGFRMIRTTGDEKVYIAQALEMKQAGHWFLQILSGEPNYFKGPLHYILLIFGFNIFGLSLWAALYMNLVICLAGALSVAEIIRQTFLEKKEWPFWGGCFFAFNFGVYGHFFASQMEVELAGLFSVAYFFLWRQRGYRDLLAFWLITGLAGWSKSPLHSVLLGSSAFLFWMSEGVFLKRILDWKSIACILSGVLLGALGFAPAFFLDHQNFVKLYFFRETVKVPNGGPWWQSLLPILTYYLLPWMGVAVLSYFEFFWRSTRRVLSGASPFEGGSKAELRLWKLCLTTGFVTILFFCLHPYRGENYTMPVTASSVFLVLLCANRTTGGLLKFRKLFIGVSGIFLVFLPVLLQLLYLRVDFSRELWPVAVLPLVWSLGFISLGLRIWECASPKSDGFGMRVALSNVGFVSLFGILLALFGEMEIQPLKRVAGELAQSGKPLKIWYWNQNRLIWNEWGLTSLAIHHPIRPILEESELFEAAQNGDLILARDTRRGKIIEEEIKKKFPHLKPVNYAWNRWKTHGEDDQGNSMIVKAWNERDVSLLQDPALILRFE